MTRPAPLPEARVEQPRSYPIPRPDRDPRFTWGLTDEIRDLLIRHGYPEAFSGLDLAELNLAVSTFLYGPPRPTFAEVDGDLATCAVCGVTVRRDPVAPGWLDSAGRAGYSVDDLDFKTNHLIHFHRVKNQTVPASLPATTVESGVQR